MTHFRKLVRFGGLALSPMLFVSPLSQAAERDYDERYYIAPMAIYQLVDDDRGTDDGFGGSVSVGRHIADNLAIELHALYLTADSDGSVMGANGSMSLIGGGVSALVFARNSLPNLFGNVGASYVDASDHPGTPPGEDRPAFHAGVGYLFPINFLTRGSAIRTEAKFFLDAHRERNLGNGGRKEFYDALFSLGLHIPLGAEPAPPPPPAKPPVQVVPVVTPAAVPDSDGDGVNDDLDQCPGTPAGTQVDEVGCALPPPAPPAPPCEAPAPGQPIDLSGCATGDVIVLKGVNFEFDRARLTANARVILDDVAVALMQVPDTAVEISGHTDSKGSDSYNQALSERRARSVRSYLIEQGVDGGRLSTRGYGEMQPIADNSTDDGRELNRRVELMFIE